jgi:FixJ family two-component response regulator
VQRLPSTTIWLCGLAAASLLSRGAFADVAAEQPEPEHVVAAMRAGGIDYLRWPFAERLLDDVFGCVTPGDERFFQEDPIRSRARAKVRELSNRETDVLTQLVRGLSNKEIGRVLAFSPRTVEVHAPT